LSIMGFWDQAAEARTKIRSPSHTITFKFFENIWCPLSYFSHKAGFAIDTAQAVVNQMQNPDENNSASKSASGDKV